MPSSFRFLLLLHLLLLSPRHLFSTCIPCSPSSPCPLPHQTCIKYSPFCHLPPHSKTPCFPPSSNPCLSLRTPPSAASICSPLSLRPPLISAFSTRLRQRRATPRKCGQTCNKALRCKRPFLCAGARCRGRKLRALRQKCNSCHRCAKSLVCKRGACMRRKSGAGKGGRQTTHGTHTGRRKPRGRRQHKTRGPCAVCKGKKQGWACRKGLRCSKNGRCVVTRALGKTCNGRCEECVKGLACVKGACARRKKQRSGKCAKCKREGDCRKGLTCRLFAPTRGRCEVKVGVGGKCAGECETCDAYLKCGKRGACERRKVGLCETCNAQEECLDGLVCGEEKRCGKLLKGGESCETGCGKCERGLVCRNGKRCEKVRRGKCGTCEKDEECKRGMVCKSGRCAKGGILGETCIGECEGCHAGLLCLHGVCKLGESRWCEKCNKDGDCKHGLVCKRESSRCSRPMDAGQSCRDKCWGCKVGLECMEVDGEKICARLKKGLCAVCEKSEDCEGGLVCEGSKCGKKVGFGASCQDQCWICEKGLKCRDGNCYY